MSDYHDNCCRDGQYFVKSSGLVLLRIKIVLMVYSSLIGLAFPSLQHFLELSLDSVEM